LRKLDIVREALEILNEEALLADGLEEAILGYTVNHHGPHVVVYDAEKCARILARQLGSSLVEAEEFLDFNTFSAYVGPNGPLFVRCVR
jgi:hypothetical protein